MSTYINSVASAYVFKRYNSVFFISVFFIFSISYLVDPYLIHQWDSSLLNRLRPFKEKLSPWAKTYAIARYQPNILYLGNSRTEVGLPTATPLITEEKVFNAALSGATLRDSIAILNHAAHFNHLKHVIWGIDFFTFNLDNGNTDFIEELVAKNDFYLGSRFLIDLQRSLSMDMMSDAVRQLTGRFGAVCYSSLKQFGQRDPVCVNENLKSRGGVEKAIPADVEEANIKSFKQTDQTVEVFNETLSKFCQQGIQFSLYINPYHALLSEVIYLNNRWENLEAWKLNLIKVVAELKQKDCKIALIDFSGFNAITTETIPLISGLPAMHYYWEASHYRINVGNLILDRLFGNKSDLIPGDFGMDLNVNTINEYLADQRAKRDIYQTVHAKEIQLVIRWLSLNPGIKRNPILNEEK